MQYQKQIKEALKFIKKNLDKNIKINQVAEVTCLSKFHFLRIYKKLQKETPYETILRLRLEKAVFFLKKYPSKKIIDVGLECGFNSVENFSRQFKAKYKVTPSVYRNRSKTKNNKE